MSPGDRHLEVRAIDEAGNEDLSPEVVQWTVDRQGPDTIILGATDTPTSAASVCVTFGCAAADTCDHFECRRRERECTRCASNPYCESVGEQMLTLEVRALDAVGNPDSTPTAVTFVIDRTPPSTRIAGGPEAITNATTTTIDLACARAEDACRFSWRLDGGPWTHDHGARVSLGDLETGRHTLDASARDAAGNRDPGPYPGHEWFVDTLAPTATITAGPRTRTVERAASFTFGCDDPPASRVDECTYEYRFDGGGWSPAPASLTGVSPGPHQLWVRAIDEAGNVGAESDPWSWTRRPDRAYPLGSPAPPTR